MAVFGIVLREPNSQVRERIEKAYPGGFELSPTFTLVTTKDIADTVANRAGIKGDDQAENVSGVVFKLQDAYSGYTTRTIWEWLGQHEDDF